jgi:hypothetical protein
MPTPMNASPHAVRRTPVAFTCLMVTLLLLLLALS